MTDRADLEGRLSSFDKSERTAALDELASSARFPGDGARDVNLHVHTFFSFNAREWSPARIAWEARRANLYAAGICDFDVLDGLEEFIAAGEALGLRATVNLETRTFNPDFADVEIDSPGEPGVSYVMGAGFSRVPDEGTPRAGGLLGYRETARARNTALVDRINARLPAIAVDYERDVAPLTPSGNATERHLVRAYIARSRRALTRADEPAAFWSTVLGIDAAKIAALMADAAVFEEKVRGRLAKRGGVAYVQPTPRTFPPTPEFFAWVRSRGAIPTESWLDGTSQGEADPRALLESSRGHGAAALNLIPDRNWNIADASVKSRKLDNLRRIIETADAMGMPINIGTEMNKSGQPFADDLRCDALAPFAAVFLRGARIMVGHTIAARFAGQGYLGEWAAGEFGADVTRRNAWFEELGALPPVDRLLSSRLLEMGRSRAQSTFCESVKLHRWTSKGD